MGRYDFAGVRRKKTKRRPGGVTAWPGHFLQNYLGNFGPRGDTKKQKPRTSHTQTATALTDVYILATENTAVTGGWDCRWFAR